MGPIKIQQGQQLTTQSGAVLSVGEYFCEGGQGLLYVDRSGKYLIKLYPCKTQERQQQLVKKFTDIQAKQTLSTWPKNFITIHDVLAFSSPQEGAAAAYYAGYVMDKLDSQFKPLSEFLSRNYLAENGYNLRKRLVVASAIAKAFRQLNHEGLAYCDISPANIMLKLAANAVQIKLIDIDNVCPSGTASYSVGTPRYMAPEVYRREYSPDVLSDDYSLAVLIFQILRCGHPFISPQDEAASFEAEEQAANALSAAHYAKDHQANLLDAEEVLSPKLQALFRRTFVDGLNNRMKRPSSWEYEIALIEASNQVVKCPLCGTYSYAFHRQVYCSNENCPHHTTPLQRGPVLRFYNRISRAGEHTAALLSETLVREFVLRDNEWNVFKIFYVHDLEALPYSAELQQKNAQLLQGTFMILFHKAHWFLNVPRGGQEAEVRFRGQPISALKQVFFKGNQVFACRDLEELKDQDEFCFLKEEINLKEQGTFYYERIARVEE